MLQNAIETYLAIFNVEDVNQGFTSILHMIEIWRSQGEYFVKLQFNEVNF